VRSLKGLPHVIDVRNLGLIGAIELDAMLGEPTRRVFSAFLAAFERGPANSSDTRHHRIVVSVDYLASRDRSDHRDAVRHWPRLGKT
jgi:adenosylmethionine-8-amino-7-oxononanoate aminotransferase